MWRWSQVGDPIAAGNEIRRLRALVKDLRAEQGNTLCSYNDCPELAETVIDGFPVCLDCYEIIKEKRHENDGRAAG